MLAAALGLGPTVIPIVLAGRNRLDDRAGWDQLPFSETYNDAGQLTSFTYSDGSALTYNYDANGWLECRLGHPTSYGAQLQRCRRSDRASQRGQSLQWRYLITAQYDNDLRPTLTKLSVSGTTKYQSQTSYDAVSNVVGVSTTLQAGTDNQALCYDARNRLTWAGASGTPPCGGSLTEGTLTSAAYTQSYGYDDLNRLTAGPAGSSYTYGGSQLDAATSTAAEPPQATMRPAIWPA